jgi:ABC-2 type transport system permease protein
LISVVARKQAVAMQAGIVSGLLPSLLLSGFIFPIESMPKFFHYMTMILPARWFMEISRSIFLRGSGLVDLAVPFGALAVLNLVLITAAAKRFKKDLEP